MKTTEIIKTEINGSIYISTTFEALGNTFSVLFVTGNTNYINIKKTSNNPHGVAGKSFISWNEAINHYKSPIMKTNLQILESIFNSQLNLAELPTLKLENRTVSKSTVLLISEYIYANKNLLSENLLIFYNDVRGIINMQLRKNLDKRLNMAEILERAYNIDKYVIAAGAIMFEQEFIRLAKNN